MGELVLLMVSVAVAQAGEMVVMAVPVGVGAAIALEEYGGRGRWARLIEINIANLAGVPSIVYGLLGLGLFVRTLRLERSLIAGAATLALLMLPMVILTAREVWSAFKPRREYAPKPLHAEVATQLALCVETFLWLLRMQKMFYWYL